MKIKAGYKLTDIGVLTKEWEVVELLTIKHGRSQKKLKQKMGNIQY